VKRREASFDACVLSAACLLHRNRRGASVKPRAIVLAATLFACSFGALADGGGSFTVKGKEFALKSACAYAHPDPYDQTRTSTVIAFSGRAFDENAIATADDPAGALSAALNSYVPSEDDRPTQVTITLARNDATSPILDISDSIPNRSSGASAGAARYTLDLMRNDHQRIEGTLRSTMEVDKTSEFGGWFDLYFALDVHPDAAG
jgi:hypothetical protein